MCVAYTTEADETDDVTNSVADGKAVGKDRSKNGKNREPGCMVKMIHPLA
jgi:hypothetical protein